MRLSQYVCARLHPFRKYLRNINYGLIQIWVFSLHNKRFLAMFYFYSYTAVTLQIWIRDFQCRPSSYDDADKHFIWPNTYQLQLEWRVLWESFGTTQDVFFFLFWIFSRFKLSMNQFEGHTQTNKMRKRKEFWSSLLPAVATTWLWGKSDGCGLTVSFCAVEICCVQYKILTTRHCITENRLNTWFSSALRTRALKRYISINIL